MLRPCVQHHGCAVRGRRRQDRNGWCRDGGWQGLELAHTGGRHMPIERMDHFTIVTKDAQTTAAFYGEMLDFEPGPRPNFMFPGVWLYSGGKAILHVIQKPEIPEGSGVLDHMAFWGTGLPGYIAKLKAK